MPYNEDIRLLGLIHFIMPLIMIVLYNTQLWFLYKLNNHFKESFKMYWYIYLQGLSLGISIFLLFKKPAYQYISFPISSFELGIAITQRSSYLGTIVDLIGLIALLRSTVNAIYPIIFAVYIFIYSSNMIMLIIGYISIVYLTNNASKNYSSTNINFSKVQMFAKTIAVISFILSSIFTILLQKDISLYLCIYKNQIYTSDNEIVLFKIITLLIFINLICSLISSMIEAFSKKYISALGILMPAMLIFYNCIGIFLIY